MPRVPETVRLRIPQCELQSIYTGLQGISDRGAKMTVEKFGSSRPRSRWDVRFEYFPSDRAAGYISELKAKYDGRPKT